MQTPTEPAPKYELWIAYTIFLTLTFLCYAPVLSPGYAVSDDFYHLARTIRVHTWFAELMTCTNLQGRPLDGLLLGFALSQVHSIADFIYLRLFGILMASVVALCSYVLLIENGWRKPAAASLALAVIAVPAFQVLAAWSIASLYILPALGAFFAVNLTKNVDKFSSRQSWLRVFLACLSLFLAISLYQPTAMFFWLYSAICLFTAGAWSSTKWRQLFTFLVVFAVASAAEIVFFELAKQFLGTAGLLPQRSHFTCDFLGKLQWFLQGPLLEALNLNRLQPTSKFALFMSAFLSCGLLLYFRGSLRARILQLGLAATFLLLSYLPNLAIAENFGTYRTQGALAALIFFYCGIAFMGVVQLLFRNNYATITSAGLVGFCLINLLMAHYHVQTFFVIPQTLELNLLKVQLNGRFGPGLQRAPLLLSRRESFAPFVRYDEFGLPSMAQPWVPEPVRFLLSHEQSNTRCGTKEKWR